MGTKNLASGTLSETITTSSTTLLVYVGAGSASTIKGVFPTAPFYITVMPFAPNAGVANSLDSEIMQVTAVSNDQVGNVALTVVRAQRGTTAKSFDSGAIVTNGIYREDVDLPAYNLDYSTTEINTGAKWIDGKAIYKKTINFGALPNNDTKRVSHNIVNLDRIIRIEQSITNAPSGSYKGFLSIASGQAAVNDFNFWGTDTQVCIRTSSDRSQSNAYFTLYYTKTS